MLLCENNGSYKCYILDSPLGKAINTVYAFGGNGPGSGFVVCERNNFLCY